MMKTMLIPKFALRLIYSGLVLFCLNGTAYASTNISAYFPAFPYTSTNFDVKEATISLDALYDSLALEEVGLQRKTYDFALKGMEKLLISGKITNDQFLTIVDFSQPSTEKRMYVIDLVNSALLLQTYVAHGQKSGKDKAVYFSNRPSSYTSSLGFYITRQPYIGSNGYSLKLEGVEKGFNDNAFKRAIVIHGASYVNENLARKQGYIGRSRGCPAVPVEVNELLINTIKEGSCLFIYHPTPVYINRSSLLR